MRAGWFCIMNIVYNIQKHGKADDHFCRGQLSSIRFGVFRECESNKLDRPWQRLATENAEWRKCFGIQCLRESAISTYLRILVPQLFRVTSILLSILYDKSIL